MAKVKVNRTAPDRVTPDRTAPERTKTEKKVSWFKRNGKKVLAIAGTVSGIAAAVFLGKKAKDYGDQWNAGQAELQTRFPDGEYKLTDEDGNEFTCLRQAFFRGGKQKSELLFWAEAPDAEDEES